MPWLPGLELSRRFYLEVVGPLLHARLGRVPHTAALLGPGSEVLGFDSERSADHDWGPRLQLLLGPGEWRAHRDELVAALDTGLPETFLGYPTDIGGTGHRVEAAELGDWFGGLLGFDPAAGVSTLDWLATPSQRLAEVTSGAVFHDGPGLLTAARERLAWYPDQVWRHVLACQWWRIDQEEPFPGRCGEAGDELGSAVVGARLVRELMRLCLLQARRYPPYGKWLGSAFARLPVAARLGPVLAAALAATGWRERERPLAEAYEIVAAQHNALELTAPLSTGTRPFHDRPFRVLGAGRFTGALRESITDPALHALPLTGAVDQFVDSTDALGRAGRSRAVTAALLAQG